MTRVVRIHAEVVDVASHTQAIRGLKRDLLVGMEREILAAGDAGQAAMRDAAPKGQTHRLEQGIAQVRSGRGNSVTVEITVEAHNPQTGYEYSGVTRFGTRAARIYPRLDRAPASVVATRRARGTNRFSPVAGVVGNAALRFVIGGRVFYRRWVRGYHPASDWSERGVAPVEAFLEGATSRLGAIAEARWSR